MEGILSLERGSFGIARLAEGLFAAGLLCQHYVTSGFESARVLSETKQMVLFRILLCIFCQRAWSADAFGIASMKKSYHAATDRYPRGHVVIAVRR